MLEEEKLYEEASHALSAFVARDVALETEAIIANDAGNFARANAADAAREELLPIILKAEESVYRANIASNIVAKANVSQIIRRDAGNCSPQEIAELIADATCTFDDDIWKTEQQLADNLDKQAQLSGAGKL